MVKGSAAPPVFEARLAEHEQLLVESAIRLVASGAARRVTLAGLEYVDLLRIRAQELAAEAGVVARAVWMDGGCDIAIESGG